MKDDVLVGLDIGTTKICVLIAKMKEKRDFEIIGIGIDPSEGLNKGVITDIEKASRVVKKALTKAESDAGLKVRQSWVSIAGDHIQAQDSHGLVKIEKADRIITARDVEKVLEDASRLVLSPDREIIHVLPQEFLVDGQSGVRKPIGISAATLGVRAHIITAASTCRQNIENSVLQSGCDCEGMVLQSLASAMATLFPEEEDLGVVLLDIGGGTTDLAIFLREGIRYTKVLGVGGNHVTNDIAVGFHTTTARAEEIKVRYGSACLSCLDTDDRIEVERVAGRETHMVSGEELVGVIQPRVEEIFEHVDGELKKSGYKDLVTAGVVLTGGCSLLRGIKEISEKVLGLPTRIGYTHINEPKEFTSPIYATAVGLVLYGIKRREELASKDKLGVRIKEWLKEFF
ncbi:MAG: cell division protein FtsA [bacterium]